MEWTAISAGWGPVYKGNFQRRFNKVSREDVEAAKCSRETLVALVQRVYGFGAEKAEAQVADWQSRQRVVRTLIDEQW